MTRTIGVESRDRINSDCWRFMERKGLGPCAKVLGMEGAGLFGVPPAVVRNTFEMDARS